MTIAVYPGSFDPVTNGHLDIATRASRIFDKVIMAVFDRPISKQPLFDVSKRLALLREATQDLPYVHVDSYTILTVEYARQMGARVILRGMRSQSDFEPEFRMAQINRTIAPDIEIVMLMSDHAYTSFSSSTVRELASLGADISWLVPPHVTAAVENIYGHSV
ncbi:MAG: pantetheine-phosphate adenylyltransferase [Chloroflexi bacterium AL-N1]|nr:pantetheine-phosphate adenylyltransferase [Chloroflexi bacterium AL-N1]NOK77313.1 pantetheine-phosphate adenylyltransferase [Chloroflexi bacterium AL-N5]